MPAQESGEPEAPQETEISIQTGVYTGMLIAAAVCMAAACAFTYFSQPFYELDESGKGFKGLKKPVYAEPGEAGLKSGSAPSVKAEAEEEKESSTEKSTEESKPAEEKAEKAEEKKPAEEKPVEEKPAEKKPAEEKKEEAKPAEEKKEG